MPDWMSAQSSTPEAPQPQESAKPIGELTPYCETAIRNAHRRIVEAPNGQQEATLNREAFGLASLVGGYGMPPALALAALDSAVRKMPSYDRRRPWRQKELHRKVTDAFAAGLRRPRQVSHG
jgi:hypothetical protein